MGATKLPLSDSAAERGRLELVRIVRAAERRCGVHNKPGRCMVVMHKLPGDLAKQLLFVTCFTDVVTILELNCWTPMGEES